jgi:MSHA biogenesis protein MshN
MSLLNNALREAEERQRRPDVTGAYTGAVQESRSGHPWLIALIFLLALGLAAAGIYWFVMTEPAPVESARGNGLASVETGQIERPQVAPEPIPDSALEAGAEPLPVSEPEPVPVPETAEVTESPVAKPQPTEKPPEKTVAMEKAPEPQVSQVDVSQPEEPEEPEPAPAVKTTPQSPEAIDRQTARELDSLIAGGRMVEAERRLTKLVQSQAAVRSRFVIARALIVEGDTQRALNWLPETVVDSDPALRMLRARALHADGQLDAAVAILASRVPGVAEQPEYRVTLATLLQQQGQGQEAAAHWAELIAWDDSRAPWWVGLAIALEDQGETRGATRAFEQAAALPGLSPSLADYVQRRLQSLRAG